MPIYEYRCGECAQVFEALQRVNDEPLDTCRRCGGPAERIISSPAIHFVGSGWYVTDYARKGKEPKGEGKEKEGEKERGKAGEKGKSGDGAAGAAKNGRGSGRGAKGGNGGAADRGSGSGGKASGDRPSGAGTERRAGAAT